MAHRYRVVITDLIDDDLAPERQVLSKLASVEALQAHCERDVLGHVEEADCVIVYHLIHLTEETISRLQRCRVIVRGGVGYDNIDHPLARKRGIPVCNVPDYGTEEVADSALAMLLSLARGVHRANSRLRSSPGEWSYSVSAPLLRLRGRVLGIVGLGRIGTAVALRGKSLGMDVLFYDPYKPDGYDKALGIRRAETLDELLRESQVVSLHCPLTDETRYLMNARTIALMPEGSYLVNTARGGVLDCSAIPDALASGHLAGAGIDVLENEPPLPGDPLIDAWRNPQHAAHHRLILNPHLAWYCQDGQLEMRRKSADTCRRALLGMPLRNVVN